MHGLSRLAKFFLTKFFLTKFFLTKFFVHRVFRACRRQRYCAVNRSAQR
jgi:hypothetical protein